MSRIFLKNVPEMESRSLRRSAAPGDPAGWLSLASAYAKYSERIGVPAKFVVPVTSKVPGESYLDRATDTIYIDSQLLSVNPYDIALDRSGHRTALIEFHSLALHELAYLKHTKWDHDFGSNDKASIASSLEALRVEFLFAGEHYGAKRWLRSTMRSRSSYALRVTEDKKVKTIILTTEILGRALLGLVSPQKITGTLEKVTNLLDDHAQKVFSSVISELRTVADDDEVKMVELTERLWSLLEFTNDDESEGPEGTEDETENSEESDKGDDTDDSESEDGDGDEDGESADGDESEGEGSGEGDPSEDGEGSGEGEESEGEGSGEGDPSEDAEGSGEGEGEGGDAEGSGEGQGEGESSSGSGQPGEGSVGEISDSDLNDLLSEAGAESSEAIKDISESKENPFKEVEEIVKDDEDLASGEDTSDFDPEAENDSAVEHGHTESYGSRIDPQFRAPTRSEQSLRKKTADGLRRAQWRADDIIKEKTDLPPGRLHVGEAIRGEVQESRGQVVTAKPWKRSKHRNAETRRVRVGVMVDASGSMAPHVRDFSSAAWSIISAVRDIGGTSVGITFGEEALMVDKTAKHASKLVARYPANGGFENIRDALIIAVEELDLYDKADPAPGPKILVIFSDGHYTASQQTYAQEELERLRKHGTAVVFVDGNGDQNGGGDGFFSGWGGFNDVYPKDEILSLSKASEISAEIARVMIKAVKDA